MLDHHKTQSLFIKIAPSKEINFERLHDIIYWYEKRNNAMLIKKATLTNTSDLFQVNQQQQA